MRRPTIRSLAGGAAGIAAGICGGIALTAGSAGNVASSPVAGRVDAAHFPQLLTLPGEPATLRYAIVCSPRDDGLPCDASGEVYARAGQRGPFRAFPLERGSNSAEGRYFVTLPPALASAEKGFSYYTVLRDDSTGAEITVPSGGPDAPQRSFLLRRPMAARLGVHPFGHTRAADARVVGAPWGSRVGQAGLAGSRELGFVGPSAFDVRPDGVVTLLDQVNGRLQHWSHGRVSETSVDVTEGLADLEIEPDGTANVLEPPDRTTPYPALRSFDHAGRHRWSLRLSDRTWTKLGTGADGPVALQEPSEQWLPLASNGKALGRAAQAARGRPGKPLGKGRELIVERMGEGELRLAELAGDVVLRGWRVTSATPLGEVQLAEVTGEQVVVVVKAYTDAESEYVVLILGGAGVLKTFSLPATEWAEGAPLARFRLSGRSLYQLGSTSAEAFVDRHDLEVTP
jgi:hypothetical protein